MNRDQFIKEYANMQLVAEMRRPTSSVAHSLVNEALAHACANPKTHQCSVKNLIIEIGFGKTPAFRDSNTIACETTFPYSDELAKLVINDACARGFFAELNEITNTVLIQMQGVPMTSVRPAVFLIERDERRKKIALILRNERIELTPDEVRVVRSTIDESFA